MTPIIEGARSRVEELALGEPAVGTTTAVHAAVTDTGAEQDVTTEITNPPEARNVTATAGGKAEDIKAVKVTITGTDAEGKALTEELPVFTVNEAGTVTGSKAFATVTKITIPAHDGEEATTAVGLGNKLGLGIKLGHDSVVKALFGGVVEGTAPTVAVSTTVLASNTAELSTELDGESAVLIDYYRS